MNICIVGTGYVGLVTGACFAEMGHTVYCVDVDEKKIENLKIGVLPIYEPGLEDIVISNYKLGRLKFTSKISFAAEYCDIYFIAVGTPPQEDGSADLKYVLNVAREIGATMQRPAIVVDKSTVPVGTAEKVSNAIHDELSRRNLTFGVDVVSNPEFLKEGAAVNDFMSPDRIVIGADSERARAVMAELYLPFTRNHPRTVYMGVRDAEMTKYAANAMLATKISFMNEIANLCELMSVDVENVRLGIGSDKRIGFHFIYPGAGYGGSCFPKDVKALVNMAKINEFDAHVLEAVEQRNEKQKNKIFEKINSHFDGLLEGKHFAVWGLAFKPGTDDMREAPSVVVIDALIGAGATVTAFDPVAMEAASSSFDPSIFAAGQLKFSQNAYEALEHADALVLMTEWKTFRNPDFNQMKSLLTSPVIFDGRNQYDPKGVRDIGYVYYGIGR